MGNHAADHEIRIDLVSFDDSFCGSYEFVVKSLISDIRFNFQIVYRTLRLVSVFFVCYNADAVISRTDQCTVDFIESQPVLYLVLLSSETCCGIFYEHIDNTSVRETMVFDRDIPWNFVMA